MKKNILTKIATICIFTTLFTIIGCKKNNAPKQKSQISVVATTFPCYDAARAVLGNRLFDGTAELKLLVKPGAESHSFDPSPADIISITDSDLFIYVGGESDEWIKKISNANNQKSERIELKLFDFVETIDEEDFDSENQENEQDLFSHQHEKNKNVHEQDEHIWTSPKNEIAIIRTVCSSLQKIANQKQLLNLNEEFEQNANNYCEQIATVSMKIAQIVLKAQKKYIVMGDRFPFIYFAKYYGLEYDAAFSGCSTAVEASSNTISRLIDKIKKFDLPAVFYIELGNHKIADIISESTGVPALLLQSCQNLSKKDFNNGETWVSLMEQNALALERGLK